MTLWDIASLAIILIWICTTIWACSRRYEKWTRVFIVAISSVSLFCIIPILLNSPLLFNAVDFLSSGLQYSEYKSSFLESIGGMLGTALAIIGALWTQHHFEQEEEHKIDIKNTTVVYYDFKFAFTEIRDRIEFCIKEHAGKPEQICPNSITGRDLHQLFTGYHILIDYKWINNVASLPNEFTSNEIEHIYYIYGLINSINQSLVSINAVTAEKIKEKLCEFYAVSPLTPICETNWLNPELSEKKNLSKDIYKKLYKIAKLRG